MIARPDPIRRTMVKIIADDSIPYISDTLSDQVDLHPVPVEMMTKDTLAEADGLIVRSVTRVDHALLEGTAVQWVGTATSGVDHMAVELMEDPDVTVEAAPGCNASAVAEYVACCLAALIDEGRLSDASLRVGVIGCGHVGQQVVAMLTALGMCCVLVDPLRALRDPTFQSARLEDCLDCDVVCLHAALHDGPLHPSLGLLGAAFFRACKPGCVIVNASRGEVLDEQALSQHRDSVVAVLDVWQGEPSVSPNLLAQSVLATPHIAGHTLEAKWRASMMVASSCAAHFGFTLSDFEPSFLAEPKQCLQGNRWIDWVLGVYDPRENSRTMQGVLLGSIDRAADFKRLRWAHYRRAFSAYQVAAESKEKDLCGALGFATLNCQP